jgi:hypothetical protein
MIKVSFWADVKFLRFREICEGFGEALRTEKRFGDGIVEKLKRQAEASIKK